MTSVLDVSNQNGKRPCTTALAASTENVHAYPQDRRKCCVYVIPNWRGWSVNESIFFLGSIIFLAASSSRALIKRMGVEGAIGGGTFGGFAGHGMRSAFCCGYNAMCGTALAGPSVPVIGVGVMIGAALGHYVQDFSARLRVLERAVPRNANVPNLDDDVDVRDFVMCPLTMEMIQDPVFVPEDGRMYERDDFERLYAATARPFSPLNRARMGPQMAYGGPNAGMLAILNDARAKAGLWRVTPSLAVVI